MMDIQKNLTNVNFNFRNTLPSWIVIHNTANGTSREGTAYNNTVYFNDTYRSASAHYFIDDGDTVWQCVRDTDTAWHVGEAASRNGCYNTNSIGIEVCETAGGWFTDKEIENLRELVQGLMKFYNIPAERICRHHDVTGKNCPWYYVDDARWDELKASILQSPDPSRKVQLYESNGTLSQKWKPRNNGDGTISFEAMCSRGKFLDVKNGSAENGAVLQIHPDNGTASQKFALRQVEDEKYWPQSVRPFELVPALDNGLRVEVKHGNDASGAAIQLYEANGTLSQQWYVLDNGDTTWTLCSNLNRKLMLDVLNGGA